MRKIFRKVLSTLLLCLVCFVALLVLAEVALRVLRPEYGQATQTVLRDDLYRIEENPRSECWAKTHPDSGTKHRVIHNSLGLRQHRDFAPKNEEVLRIGFFGDSFTENVRMEAQYSFTEPLQYLLNRAGVAAEVLNFGMDGYSLDQSVLLYREDAANLGLDWVFYTYNHDDLYGLQRNQLVSLKDGKPVFREPERRFWTRMARKLYLTFFLIDVGRSMGVDYEHDLDEMLHKETRLRTQEAGRSDKALMVMEKSRNVSPDDSYPTLDLFWALLADWRTEVENAGARFDVAVLPLPEEATMLAAMRTRGYDPVDFPATFAEQYQDETEYLFAKDGHWNEEANKLAAVILFCRIADELGVAWDCAFVEQALYEYYTAFDTPPVSGLFIRMHQEPEAGLAERIRAEYLSLDETHRDNCGGF